MPKTLFIGCHCDDIELGCGGTISKFRDQPMDAVILSQKTLDGKSLKNISYKTLNQLGINNIYFYKFKPSFFYQHTQQIWEVLKQYDTKQYNCIFTQESDTHQDHCDLFHITNRMYLDKSIITYSSSVVSCPEFKPNYFIGLKKKNVNKKLRSLKKYKIYKDKIYFQKEIIMSNLLTNGAISGHKYAEGFRIHRVINASPFL